jgi:hypothetical protein
MIFAPLMVQAVHYYSAWEKQIARHRGDAVLALYQRDDQLYLSPLMLEDEEDVIFPIGRWDVFFVMYDGEYQSIRGRHVPPELMQFKFDGVHLHELTPIPFREEPFPYDRDVHSVEDFCKYNGWFPTKRVALGPKHGIVCFTVDWSGGLKAMVYGPRGHALGSGYGFPSGLMTFVKQFGLPCSIEAECFGPPRKKPEK